MVHGEVSEEMSVWGQDWSRAVEKEGEGTSSRRPCGDSWKVIRESLSDDAEPIEAESR